MFLTSRKLFLFLLIFTFDVHAEGYVLGIGAEGDSADGRSFAAFGDFGLAKNTWLSVSANSSRTESLLRTNDTVFADAGVDHWFGPIGIRLGASYWGNSDILDSRDLRASLYVRGDAGSISFDYQDRDFEFDLQSDLLRGRTVSFGASGVGLTGRMVLGEQWTVRLSGMRYDYSRNIRLQPDIDVLTFIARSRLSMVNSLVDDRVSAGLEYNFGLKSVDVTAGRWQTAVDGSQIDSYSVGYLTPLTDRIDLELRLALDESEGFGTTTSFSFYVYYFGGV